MDKSFLIEQLGARMREAVQSTHQAAREASQDARSGASRAVNLAKGQLQRSTTARCTARKPGAGQIWNSARSQRLTGNPSVFSLLLHGEVAALNCG